MLLFLRTKLLRFLQNGYALLGLVLIVFAQIARIVSRYAGTGAAVGVFAVLLGVVFSLIAINWRAHKRVRKLVEEADQLQASQKFPEALRLCDQALEIVKKRKLAADDLVAMLLVIRSIAAQRVDKKDEALNNAAQAFACMCAIKNAGTQVAIFDQLGLLLLEMGQERRAIPILEAAVGLGARLNSDPIQTAGRLERVGLACLRVGVHANSVAAFGKAIDLITREKGADAPGLANIYINLGNGYKRMQQLDDAERCYRETLRIYQINGVTDNEKLSLAMLNVGVVCAESGRNEEAEALYQEVLRMRVEALGRNHWRVGNTYNNLANCRRRQRDFEGARQYAKQAIEILESRPESLCNAMETMSRILEDEGRLEEALASTARAREIQQNLSSPDLSELATLYEREGLLASRNGDEDRAADCRKRATEIRQALAAAPPADRDLTDIQESLRTLELHLNSSLARVRALQTTAH